MIELTKTREKFQPVYTALLAVAGESGKEAVLGLTLIAATIFSGISDPREREKVIDAFVSSVKAMCRMQDAVEKMDQKGAIQ